MSDTLLDESYICLDCGSDPGETYNTAYGSIPGYWVRYSCRRQLDEV